MTTVVNVPLVSGDKEARERAEAMTEREWQMVGRLLGIPGDWTLRPHKMAGRWRLTATASRSDPPLPCGHRSMQVTATALPLAVAKMVGCVEFHRTER